MRTFCYIKDIIDVVARLLEEGIEQILTEHKASRNRKPTPAESTEMTLGQRTQYTKH